MIFFLNFSPENSHTNPHVPNSCLVPVIDTYGGLKVRFPQSALLTRGALLTRIDCRMKIVDFICKKLSYKFICFEFV